MGAWICSDVSTSRDDTRRELVAHAQRDGELRHGTDAERAEFTRRSGEMFQMLAATAEFQFC